MANSFLVSLLKNTLGRLNKKVHVSKIETITNQFIRIELSGEPFKKVKWQPGCKIQVDVSGSFSFRTFTPLAVDAEAGKLSFIVFRRSGHLATDWVDSLKLGKRCEVFGPRESLNLINVPSRVAIFGDETSIGIAKVLKDQSNQAELFFETSAETDVSQVFETLQIKPASVVQSVASQSHINELVLKIVEMNKIKPFEMVFLTGRAKSIQTLRTKLKEHKIESSKFKTKAYWADGKSGLD